MRSRKRCLGLTAVVLTAVVFAVLVTNRPAAADFTDKTVAELSSFITSGASLNLRLMALDAMRKKSSTAIDDELVKIAKGSDLRIAIYSATALGKRKTTTSKSKLLSLLADTKVKKDVRMAAMTAVAVHFKDSGDLDDLYDEAKSDSDLKAHYLWLKSNVYGR
jgi:hypothetical protein